MNDLTVEDLNSVLMQAVDSQNHELIDWLLHSNKIKNRPDIHKQKRPDNPILSALKNNDIKSMLLLCHKSTNNQLLQDKVSMDRCLEFASESSMWEMCHFLTDVIEQINPFIPYKYALYYKEENEALLFYDKIKDKSEAFMCACYYGSELLFNKSRTEDKLKINYDLSFAYIIKSENKNLIDKFLNLYENEINWLKHDYFVQKIIDTKNVENLAYILNHAKIKDNFNLKTYEIYFNYLISQKDDTKCKEMLDYLVLDYALPFNGINIQNNSITINEGKKIKTEDKEYIEDFFKKRDAYISMQQKLPEKNQTIPTKVKKI